MLGLVLMARKKVTACLSTIITTQCNQQQLDRTQLYASSFAVHKADWQWEMLP